MQKTELQLARGELRRLKTLLTQARESRDRWRDRYEKEHQQLNYVLKRYKFKTIPEAAPIRWSADNGDGKHG